MSWKSHIRLVAASAALLCTHAFAHADHAEHTSGKVDFKVSCSAKGQAEFTKAVILLHHMTYPQARTAFEHAAEADPECAMAHWGVAMTLFQPLWPTRPSAEDLRRGREESRKAGILNPPTERERLFIASTSAFFSEPASLTYWQRIARWREGMEKLHSAFPQDAEATTFYALSLLATAPSDKVSLEGPNRAADLLLGVYKQNPDHPGAMHYLVHANDVPGREHELLEIVRKYAAVAPDNPHALHMPTHIFTRLGDWDAVISGNLRAADAALKYPAGDHGQLVWDEFPHAIEYLVYAYLQEAQDDKAAEQIKRLRDKPALEPSFKTAFHLSSTQARYSLERRKWNEAIALEPRMPANLDWDKFQWPEAVTWFARGLGAAHSGKLDDARTALNRLTELEAASGESGEALFTRQIKILRLGTSAWLAQVNEQPDASLQQMREAAELEASTPKPAVTPAPTLPAYELLGDLLMEQQQPKEALVAYQKSLELYPRRFNSLSGAVAAARASGDEAKARGLHDTLMELTGGKATR
jgi:tetratricopeptide (TPR) repeat protein